MPSRPPYASALAFSASNSACVSAPASSSSLALALGSGPAARRVAHLIVERLPLGHRLVHAALPHAACWAMVSVRSGKLASRISQGVVGGRPDAHHAPRMPAHVRVAAHRRRLHGQGADGVHGPRRPADGHALREVVAAAGRGRRGRPPQRISGSAAGRQQTWLWARDRGPQLRNPVHSELHSCTTTFVSPCRPHLAFGRVRLASTADWIKTKTPAGRGRDGSRRLMRSG